jgi:hypothetical protein
MEEYEKLKLERNTHILMELEGKNKEYWVVSSMPMRCMFNKKANKRITR